MTRFTDDVKRIKKQADNLYLVNYANTAFSKLLFQELEKCKAPKYVQFYSTDWTLPAAKIKEYMQQGYKIVYEYIDDLNPHLAGTDELPVNVKEKYDLAKMSLKSEEMFGLLFQVMAWIMLTFMMGAIRILSVMKSLSLS